MSKQKKIKKMLKSKTNRGNKLKRIQEANVQKNGIFIFNATTNNGSKISFSTNGEVINNNFKKALKTVLNDEYEL